MPRRPTADEQSGSLIGYDDKPAVVVHCTEEIHSDMPQPWWEAVLSEERARTLVNPRSYIKKRPRGISMAKK